MFYRHHQSHPAFILGQSHSQHSYTLEIRSENHINTVLLYVNLWPDLGLERTCIAVWSTLIGRGMSRLVSNWSRASLVMLAPAVLCHKEPARASKAPTRGFE